MSSEEILISQVRNICRISTRYVVIYAVREKSLLQAVLDMCIHGGKSTFHLIENNTVVERFILLNFVVPALLTEDAVVMIDRGTEDRVKIYPCKIYEILLVLGGYRIHGLIREGHGVQEGIHGAFDQIQEGFLHGIIIRTCQH